MRTLRTTVKEKKLDMGIPPNVAYIRGHTPPKQYTGICTGNLPLSIILNLTEPPTRALSSYHFYRQTTREGPVAWFSY